MCRNFSFPLNHLDSQDNLTWIENMTQQFSVKSTYRVALKLKFGDWAEHSSTREHDATWGRIWKLNFPLKVLTFIWKACNNHLPTRNNLCQRKAQIEATCEFCQREPETTNNIPCALVLPICTECVGFDKRLSLEM